MDKLRCVIVDDEPLAVELLAGYARRTPSLELVGTYTDPVEALSEIASSKPDLVFLDIQMPDMNGLELSRMISEHTMIVFTTAFKEYAFESYEVDAVDYLLKPIRYQKFLEAVARAEKRMVTSQASAEPVPEERESAFFKVDGQFRNINFSDIVYVSSMKDYVMLKLQGEVDKVVTHLTMKAVEDLLPYGRFMRVHRSYIVALDKITSIDGDGDIMLGTDLIPVSESHRKKVEAFLSSRLFASKP